MTDIILLYEAPGTFGEKKYHFFGSYIEAEDYAKEFVPKGWDYRIAQIDMANSEWKTK